MNGFQFSHLVSHLAYIQQSRRATITAVLVAISMIVIGLVWLGINSRLGGSTGRHQAVRATLADAPSWDVVKPEWPRYMPVLPPPRESVASQSPIAATITPTVVRGLPEPDATLPLVTGGAELFAPTPQPAPVAKIQPQPAPPPALPQSVVAPSPAPRLPPQLSSPRPAPPMPAPAAMPTYVPVPVTQPVRSEAMERIATQADQQTHHGFELAGRGAYFAARAEFTAALRMIAQGLDNEFNTKNHSQALSAALTAMKEAQDFIPAAGKLEGDLDLPSIVAGHRTPVLKDVPLEKLQAMRAMKQYFTFAQEQLAVAAGQEVSGSVALEALGKLHATLAGKQIPEIAVPATKAIAFFQASILVCPRNYMAANELGVLFAHNGDFTEARRMLEHSVLLCRCPENLNNLAVVYRHLGQQRLADLAAEKAHVAIAAETARQKSANLSAGGSVEWVDPAALAQSQDQWTDPSTRPAIAAGRQDPATTGPASANPVVGIAPVPYGPATRR